MNVVRRGRWKAPLSLLPLISVLLFPVTALAAEPDIPISTANFTSGREDQAPRAPVTRPVQVVQAASPEPREPAPEQTLLSADEVVRDDELGLIIARGNVELSRGERVLVADTVTYNTRTEVVTASGNVSLLQPNRDVVFAQYVELTDDLKEGFIRDIRVIMSDSSRIAADDGVLTEGNRTSFRRGVYSPCGSCDEDPSKPPLWQLKAQRIVHDQDEQVIRYRNAWLELGGVPVGYLPYFSHADPTVERQSGFLTPVVGVSGALGATVQVPYYWAISPTADATFEPLWTMDQGPVFAGQYRQRLTFGHVEFEGSATVADREDANGVVRNDVLRGHIDAMGRFDIDETWRTGFDLERTSDDTYLRLYNLSRDQLLTSSAFVEGFEGRDYVNAQGLLFQGLRADDDNDEQPVAAPILDYNYVSEPLFADSVVSMDANISVLTRVNGRDTRRASLHSGWTLPFQDPIGGLYTLGASLQTDGYWVDEFEPGSEEIDPSEPTDTTLSGRVFPQAFLNWRYPWASYSGPVDQIIEPMVQLVAGLEGGNPDSIPNEDSLDFEFDDTNLFSPNRFPGVDRVDPGQRADYGLTWRGTTERGAHAQAFIGQSYRLESARNTFPLRSGVEDQFSDIVGRVDLQPFTYVDLLYRFRLDKDNFEPRRNELTAQIGPPALNFNVNYLFLESQSGEFAIEDREEIRGRVNMRFSRYWSGFAASRRDLVEDNTLETSVGLTYQDECLQFQIIGKREFFRDREIDSEDSIFFRIVLNNLGGFDIDQNALAN